MIRVNKGEVTIQGRFDEIAAELAGLLESLREDDEEIIPSAMACAYTKGVTIPLSETIENYKADTNLTIKLIERAYKRKGER